MTGAAARSLIIVEGLKFHKRDRQPSENVAAYVSELRRLSVTCDFENNLDSSLMDRLVCGINDDGIQRRLLAEKTLDFKGTLAWWISTPIDDTAISRYVL